MNLTKDKINPQIYLVNITKMLISILINSVVTNKANKVYSPAHLMISKQVKYKKYPDFFLTTMTIVKTVIGSGILAIPYTMAKMGYVFGIIVFILAGSVAQYGTVLLLKAKNLSHHSNLSTIFY